MQEKNLTAEKENTAEKAITEESRTYEKKKTFAKLNAPKRAAELTYEECMEIINNTPVKKK